MPIIKSLLLSHFFAMNILMIVLAGILFLEYFKRKPQKRKGILVFGFLSIGIIGAITTDIYRKFFGYSLNVLFSFIFFYFFLLLLFTLGSIRVWNQVDKKLFYFIAIFACLSISFYILDFYIDVSDLIDLIFIGVTYVSFYFFIIKFIIKTSGDNKMRKKARISKKETL